MIINIILNLSFLSITKYRDLLKHDPPRKMDGTCCNCKTKSARWLILSNLKSRTGVKSKYFALVPRREKKRKEKPSSSQKKRGDMDVEGGNLQIIADFNVPIQLAEMTSIKSRKEIISLNK